MKDMDNKKNINGAESLVSDVLKVADVKSIKPIKLKQFYKDIKVTKILNLKYAGAYRNYSEFNHPYVYVFFNEKTEEKINIKSNKVTSWAWGFKEGYTYDIGFNKVGDVISLRNRDKYLCYYIKPNRIFFIDFEKKIRKWVNKPANSKQPSIEDFLIKL